MNAAQSITANPTMPTTLTPEMVTAVLKGLARFEPEASVGEVADYEADARGYGIVAGIEAVAALDRAGSAKPLVDVIFGAFSCWTAEREDTPADLTRLRSGPLNAIRDIKHTIYALLGGAYAELARTEHAPVFEELVSRCHDVLLEAADESEGEYPHEDARALADLATWLVALARPFDDDAARTSAIEAGGNAAAYTARWVLKGGIDIDVEAFIDKLRAIPAAR